MNKKMYIIEDTF